MPDMTSPRNAIGGINGVVTNQQPQFSNIMNRRKSNANAPFAVKPNLETSCCVDAQHAAVARERTTCIHKHLTENQEENQTHISVTTRHICLYIYICIYD